MHLVAKISRMRRTAVTLQEIFGREPSDEELAGELGISTRRVRQWHSAIPAGSSRWMRPLGNEDSTTLSEVVKDDRRRDAV